jgi:hypothetical protein
LVERVVSGDNPDAYVTVSVEDSACARVEDSFTSTVQSGSSKPVWNESFSLYVRNVATTTLKFLARDRDYFKQDDDLGIGRVTLQALLQGQGSAPGSPPKPAVNVPIPLYVPQKPSLFQPSKNKRTGTLLTDLQYVSFGAGSGDGEATVTQAAAAAAPAGEPAVLRNLPQGATPGASWAALLSRLLGGWSRPSRPSTPPDSEEEEVEDEEEENSSIGRSRGASPPILASMRLDSLRHVCSVENTETDTQASIYADLSAKVLVASFRGTEQIKIQDILTDINLKQTPFFPTSTSTSTSTNAHAHPQRPPSAPTRHGSLPLLLLSEQPSQLFFQPHNYARRVRAVGAVCRLATH